MQGVWYAGDRRGIPPRPCLFLGVYARRGSGPAGRHGAAPADPTTEAARAGAGLRAGRPSPRPCARRRRPRPKASGGLPQTEAEATRRAAKSDAEAAPITGRDHRRAGPGAGCRGHQRRTPQRRRRRGQADRRELARQQDAQTARIARLDETEARLDAQEARLAQALLPNSRGRPTRLAAAQAGADERARQFAADQAALDEATRRHKLELERIAGLTAEGGEGPELLAGVESGARREGRRPGAHYRERGAHRGAPSGPARSVVEAVQRVASAQTTETVVSVLHLPSDEDEGPHHRPRGPQHPASFEGGSPASMCSSTTTPEAVLLSCFDPVRREVGRLTLEKLIADGRIHPHRIEEAQRTEQGRGRRIVPAARPATRFADVGVGPIDERLMPTIGRLKYRTSYGAERARPPHRNRAHRRGDGRRTGHRAHAGEALRLPARHRQGAHSRGRGQPRHHRRRAAAQVRRGRGGGPRRRGAPQRGAAQDDRGGVLTQASDTCSAARPRCPPRVDRGLRQAAGPDSRRSPPPGPGVDKVFAMQSGREVRGDGAASRDRRPRLVRARPRDRQADRGTSSPTPARSE